MVYQFNRFFGIKSSLIRWQFITKEEEELRKILIEVEEKQVNLAPSI